MTVKATVVDRFGQTASMAKQVTITAIGTDGGTADASATDDGMGIAPDASNDGLQNVPISPLIQDACTTPSVDVLQALTDSGTAPGDHNGGDGPEKDGGPPTDSADTEGAFQFPKDCNAGNAGELWLPLMLLLFGSTLRRRKQHRRTNRNADSPA